MTFDSLFRTLGQSLTEIFGGVNQVQATVTNPADGSVGLDGKPTGANAQTYTVDCPPPYGTTIEDDNGLRMPVITVFLAAALLEAATANTGSPEAPKQGSTLTVTGWGQTFNVVRVDKLQSGTQFAGYQVHCSR